MPLRIEGMLTGTNAQYLDQLVQQFLDDPSTLEPSWRAFFQGEGAAFVSGGRPVDDPGFGERSIFAGPVRSGESLTSPSGDRVDLAFLNAQLRTAQLINAYRTYGHLKANLDPLGLRPRHAHPRLELGFWGLSDYIDTRFSIASVYGAPASMTIRELVALLDETYARTIGAEYMHLSSEEVEWFQRRCEPTRNHCALDQETQRFILERLCTAEAFEKFIHVSFSGYKRFSLEGAESLIPLLALMIEHGAQHGVGEVVLGMPHRGRLNVLTNIFQKDPRLIFKEFADKEAYAKDLLGRGDVKYHMGYSSDFTTRHGHPVHLTMAFNPSHLEAINPIVEGRSRAKQDREGRDGPRKVLPVLLHGDAAFPGQGLVAETLNLMSLPGYRTGGTIHVIVNNQIGFTTDPEDARSSTYCTDIAKMIEVPIFHVNGEDPEAVVQAAHLAAEYRQTFGKDFIIDMYCFRRYGHNETDEPKFTQPMMYQKVNKHPAVNQVYAQRLARQGAAADDEAHKLMDRCKATFGEALEDSKQGKVPANNGGVAFRGMWADYRGGADSETPEADTSISEARFHEVLTGMTALPEGFSAHSRVQDVLNNRYKMGLGELPLDWGAGEMLAYGTLLQERHPIRISGQDVQRGTFSHRHAIINDQQTGAKHPLLASFAAAGDTRFEVYNSPLSEAAVLGFEFGYALDTPEALVIWEAQFGDFVNGAQVIIDQFLSSCEDKWERLSAVTLLLPHGYEGQGPEHSSGRLERFLQLCAEDNMQVCNLSTPAQIFHALRRQVLRPWRKPLVVMTPKSLLRHPSAVSAISDFTTGGFQRVIPDTTLPDAAAVRRAVISSGKVYYDLLARRDALEDKTTALIRLEQFYPFPKEALGAAVAAFPNVEEVVSCQEEPQNMGAYYFLHPRLTALFAGGPALRWESRDESASPATGSSKAHAIEQADLMDRVFRPLTSR
jgi:2-oxoglutarate dehydrogenase E1 component